MSNPPPEEWQFWETLRISRFPLSFVPNVKKRRQRTQMREFSESAFVHRMFDLFFAMRQDWVIEQLTPLKKTALQSFQTTWESLPWKPLESHPHICEVSDAELKRLVVPAQALDRRLELRTGDSLVPVVYRLFIEPRELH